MSGPGASVSVCVVDDTEAQRYVITRSLRHAGFHVAEGANGEAAFALAQQRPDVILLDVSMPGMDGFEVCRRLKSDPRTADIPVLQMSACYIRAEHRLRGLRLGADDYLVHPITAEELVAKVNVWARVSRLDAQLRAANAELQAQLTERAAQLRRLQLQARLLDLSMEPILMRDAQDCIIYWNHGAERLYGWTREEVLGRVSHDLLRTVFPKPLAEVLAELRETGHWSGELLHTTKSGDQLVVASSWTLQPIDEQRFAVLVTNHDLTAVRRAEQIAETRLAQLRVTLDSLSEAVFVCDATGAPLLWNPEFLRITGLDPRRLPGDYSSSVSGFELLELNGRVVPVSERPVAVALRGQAVSRRELRVRRSGGQDEKTLRFNAAPVLDPQGRVIMAVLGIEDISAAKHAEAALVRSEKLAGVGRMAATIAHEINNPLAAAMNALYLVASDALLSDSARRNLDIAEQELDRVAHITKQTLGFYRESGAPGPVDLTSLVDGILDLYGTRLKSRDIRVLRRFRGPARVQGLEGELRQLIANLVGNALDALPEGGALHLRVAGPYRSDGHRPMLRLTIADSGTGISPENLKLIFEPFFTTKQSIGTGLGLWVTKELVKRHGGRLRVRSRLGQGTVFSILLPAERRQHERADNAA